MKEETLSNPESPETSSGEQVGSDALLADPIHELAYTLGEALRQLVNSPNSHAARVVGQAALEQYDSQKEAIPVS